MNIEKPSVESDEELFNINETQRKLYAQQILYQAIKYVMGYLTDYKVMKEQDFNSNPMWIKITVWWDEESAKEDAEEFIKAMERKAEEIAEKKLKELFNVNFPKDEVEKEEKIEEETF